MRQETTMTVEDDKIPTAVREGLEAYQAVIHAMHRTKMTDWVHLNLTMGQLKALVTLASTGAINVSGLAERLELSKSATSILVDQLVHHAYAVREEDAEDRRRTLVYLSASGRELAAWLQQSGGGRMASWLGQLAPEDLAALTCGLRALAAVVARANDRQAQQADMVPSAPADDSGIAED
jgi:DNA-binding MarR family transcriptional regulator